MDERNDYNSIAESQIYYEYRTLSNQTYIEETLLNRLGEQGWELITHVYDTRLDRHIYTFKRPVSK